MKLTKIKFKNYDQFQDLELDLTYPSDFHDPDLRGKPLKKVCFIGPNGVGKTKILGSIRSYFLNWELWVDADSNIIITEDNGDKNLIKTIFLPLIGEYKTNEISRNDFDISYNSLIQNDILNFETVVKNKHIILGEDFFPKFSLRVAGLNQKRVLELAEYISQGILDNEKTKIGQEIKLSFDSIIYDVYGKNFGLKYQGFVKEVNNLAFIHNNSKPISINDLSSGIKQVLFKFFTLRYLQPKDFVILIDEPENSLFPDIQKRIVSAYTSIGSDNQFFFATHSPLVVAQFEPCEIFPLDFDKQGRVVLKERPIGSEGWSGDEMLAYWFGTDSRNPVYYQLLDEYYNLLKIKNRSDLQEKRLLELRNSPILTNYFG